MFVQTILDSKGTDVVSVAPSASLADAAQLLAQRRIGAVIVRDDKNALVGILSERDIVRAVARSGAACLTDTVASVMTRNVVTCTRESTIGELMEQMTEGKFRHLPVLENDRVVGVVSIGDVVKYRIREVETESVQLREYILNA